LGKENKHSQWSNATTVLYFILTVAATLYILNQVGWGPSLKTKVTHWLWNGGYAVKEVSDPATNFTFEVTNRRDGKGFYVGNRKGFDGHVLVQAFFYPKKLFPAINALEKPTFAILLRRLQADIAAKGVFYEALEDPLPDEIKLSKTLVAGSLTEEKLSQAINDVMAAAIILSSEIGIALYK
jgi:hypothetical protein